MLNPGTQVGHYSIVAQVGAGGMGEVEAFWRRPIRHQISRAERVISC